MMAKGTPSKEYLERLSWEEKAQRNPLYGIMSVEGFAASTGDPSPQELEAFYADGKGKVEAWLLPWLESHRATAEHSILEYGCGMGRLVNSLKDRYPRVAGADISQTMVDRATRQVPGPRFRALDETGNLPFDDHEFDFVYSYAVFQHINRWSALRRAIAELGRVTKPGGYAKLQFDMVFPPGILRPGSRARRTRAFESRSLIYGWTGRFGVPVPGARLLAHNHWGGVRPGYGQIVRELQISGFEVYGIECMPEARHLVWFCARRRSD